MKHLILLICISVANFSYAKQQSYPKLILVKESKIHKLMKGYKKSSKFEASGISFINNNFHIVFDNLNQIAQVKSDLLKNNKQNILIGNDNSDSDFEGITYNNQDKLFYIIKEATKYNNKINAQLHTYKNDFQLINIQPLNFNLPSLSDGFEGIVYLNNKQNKFLLALCESNACEAGDLGKISGKGRMQLFKYNNKSWQYIKAIKLPKSVTFSDYSGIDINSKYQIAIVSQMSAKMWIGKLNQNLEVINDGQIYDFPLNKKNKSIYCNVEGVTWISNETLATVTDKRKKKSQKKRCKSKDQSVQIFQLP
jgi:uncharacterized protein YjiK